MSSLEDERDELQNNTSEGIKSNRLSSGDDGMPGRMLGELKRRRGELERSKTRRHALKEKIEVTLASSESRTPLLSISILTDLLTHL